MTLKEQDLRLKITNLKRACLSQIDKNKRRGICIVRMLRVVVLHDVSWLPRMGESVDLWERGRKV